MSGGINKIIFIFVGLFLTVLIVAVVLGRFKFLGINEPKSTGSLGDALALKPAEEKKGIWESLFGKKNTTASPASDILPTQVVTNPTITPMISLIPSTPIPTIPVVIADGATPQVAGSSTTKGGVEEYYWNDTNSPQPVELQYTPESIPATGSPVLVLLGSAASLLTGIFIKKKAS